MGSALQGRQWPRGAPSLQIVVRRTFLVLLLASLFLALALFVVVRLVDFDGGRDDLERALAGALGLDVRIDSPLRLDWGWRPEIVVSQVVIYPAGDSTAPLARLDAVAFEADLPRSLRERRVVIRQVRASGLLLELRRNQQGVGNWQLRRERASRSGPAGLNAVILEDVLIEDARVTYETAMSDWSFEMGIEWLDLDARQGGQRLLLSAHGHIQDDPFTFEASVATEDLKPRVLLGDWSHVDVQAMATLGPLSLVASGGVDDPRRRARVDLQVSGHLDDFGQLRDLVSMDPKLKLKGIGAFDFTGRLLGGDGSVHFEDLFVRIAGPRTGSLEGRGRIGDLVKVRDIDLALTMKTQDLAGVTARLRIPHPRAGSASGTGWLRGQWPSIAFEDVSVEAEHVDGHALKINGDVRRVRKKWAGDLWLEVDAPRAGDIAQVIEEVVASLRPGEPMVRLGRPDLRLQQLVMAIGPAQVRGHLKGRDKDWTLDSVEANAGHDDVDWFRATGGIRSLAPEPRGIAFDVEAGSNDLGPLMRRAQVPLLGLERLRLTGEMVGDADQIVFHNMQAVAGTPGRLSVGLSGDMPMRDTVVGAELFAAVSAESLAVVGDLFGRSLPAVGPFEFSAEVHADGEALNGHDLRFLLGESRLGGVFRVEPQGGRSHVTANFMTDRFHLRDLGLSPSDPSTDSAEETGWVDRVVPFEDLLEVDGDLVLEIDELVGREGLEVTDFRLWGRLREGVLNVRDLGLTYEGGLLNANLRVDARNVPAEVDLHLKADVIRIDRVLAQFVEKPFADGTAQIVADISSRGVTARELGANLAGDLFFYGRAGGLSRRYSHALQLDLGTETARRVKAGEFEPVECLIVDASARNGLVALETVLFDTEDKQVLGAGDIDMAREEIQVMLTPVFKDPIPGSVATSVRVQGSLTDPSINPAPLVTAAGAAQGLVDRALMPLNSILPGLGNAVVQARRAADRAMETAGIDLPASGLWRPGIDVTCERVLQTERIEALRSVAADTPD